MAAQPGEQRPSQFVDATDPEHGILALLKAQQDEEAAAAQRQDVSLCGPACKPGWHKFAGPCALHPQPGGGYRIAPHPSVVGRSVEP